MMRDEVIPAGTLLAYKILPGSQLSDVLCDERFTYGEQGTSDWSAIYAQFGVAHAVSYLPNHWDRGSTSAMLVGLTVKRALRALVLGDAATFGDPAVDSSAKAGLVRRAVRDSLSAQLEPGRPLLEAVGLQLGAVLVLQDADEPEVAIPHGLATPENFSFTVLATLERDARQAWATRGAVVRGVRLECSKREREDVRALGERLDALVASDWCAAWGGALGAGAQTG